MYLKNCASDRTLCGRSESCVCLQEMYTALAILQTVLFGMSDTDFPPKSRMSLGLLQPRPRSMFLAMNLCTMPHNSAHAATAAPPINGPEVLKGRAAPSLGAVFVAVYNTTISPTHTNNHSKSTLTGLAPPIVVPSIVTPLVVTPVIVTPSILIDPSP